VEKRDSIAEGNEEEEEGEGDVMDDEQDDNNESYLQGEEGDRIRQLEKQLKMLEEGMSLDAASAAGNLDQLELQLQDDEEEEGEEEYDDNGDDGDQEVVGAHRFITNDEVQALYLPDNNWYDAIILNRHHDEATGASTYDIQFVGFEGDEGYEENKPAEEVASIQEYSGDELLEEGEEWDEEGEEGEISQ
jgi:hypothetical protein